MRNEKNITEVTNDSHQGISIVLYDIIDVMPLMTIDNNNNTGVITFYPY